MNLRQIRLKFREISGRYDLVDAAGKDLGANFFINAGIRRLDRRSNFQKSVARAFSLEQPGTYLVKVQRARAITEVWMATQEARWQLRPAKWQDLRATYTKAWASLERGTSAHYSPTYLRPVPEELDSDAIVSLDWVVQYMDVVYDGTHQLYNAVLIMPPPESEVMVEIIGTFYSNELSNDTDHNMWTELWPDLVIQAACLELEMMHRNTQGMQDWHNAMEMSLVEIEKDGVEEMSAGDSVMEG